MSISPEILAQYAALTSSVGLADLSGGTLIEVTGNDRVQLLHAFTTGDVKKLVAGRGCEAFVTSPQGKTLGHVLILHRGASLLLIAAPGQAGKLIGHFDRFVISEDVTLSDDKERLGLLLVAGPKATQALRAVAGAEPPAELLAHASVAIAGKSTLLVRVEHVLPLSYYLVLERGDLPEVKQALEAAGVVPCGMAAVEMGRLESGIPAYDQDITDDNLPQEIARDARAISFTKGCYLGQETIARIDAVGHVNRQLARVQFTGTSIPPVGTQLAFDGKPVGHVTSAAWSPRLQAPLALALLRRLQAKAGTNLTSPAGEAIVVALPAG